MSAAVSTTPAQPPVAARAALDADYLLQWQDDIERFGNAYYRGLALRHGDGDVRLKVSVQSDGSLRQIDLLQSSGSAALDRVAVDTVEKLAPFAPFPEALAHETQQLDIVRTWQFRR
jgi:protein TonB